MTTQIGERFWTYYKDGVYPCTCFFCKVELDPPVCRWHSRLPTSVYACNYCFENARILPGLYPETHQASFGTPDYVPPVAEKAVEVPGNARKFLGGNNPTLEPVDARTAKETRIMTAHEENMESAKQTRSMLSCLVSAIVDLTRQLEAMSE